MHCNQTIGQIAKKLVSSSFLMAHRGIYSAHTCSVYKSQNQNTNIKRNTHNVMQHYGSLGGGGTVQITHKLNNTRVSFAWRGCCFCYTHMDNFKSTCVYTCVQSLQMRVQFLHTCAFFCMHVLQFFFAIMCVFSSWL